MGSKSPLKLQKNYFMSLPLHVSIHHIKLNFASTISGEVFVLDDGGEVDLDLGNYERFLDVTLHRDNNITTGKVYKQVIEKEREGQYLGKTVQGDFPFVFVFVTI